MAKVVKIEDKETICCVKMRLSNARICLFFSVIQMTVALTAIAQHVYSLNRYNKIFLCWFGLHTTSSEDPEFSHLSSKEMPVAVQQQLIHKNKTDPFLAADVIIFDFGLFHELLGIPECVANQFDGGYLRAIWCVCYVGSLILLVAVIIRGGEPKPRALLPILLQQSVYMLGLIMLTLATIRKLLWALTGHITAKLFRLILFYFLGGALNCYFGITLWHFYWYWKDSVKHKRSVPPSPVPV